MNTEESKRKVKGTLHWVSVKHAVKAEVRAYDRLFLDEAPDSHKDKDYMEFVNPNSLEVITAFEKVSEQQLKYQIVERREGDVIEAFANTDKANTVLGWKAQSTLEDALASAWKWEKKIRS